MKGTSIVLAKSGQFIEGKRAEVLEGEKLIAELVATNKFPKRLTRIRRRVEFMQKFINLAEAGFIPLPRMERELISEDTALPADALISLLSFREIFDAIAIVRGDARGKALDPMLIGIIRSGDDIEEHFLLGWWRPDLISPSQLW